MKNIEKVKLLKADGSIIVRPKSVLKAALKKGLKLIPELQNEITSGKRHINHLPKSSTIAFDVTASESEFQFNINRSANVVINELSTLTSDELDVVLSLENSRKKPRKSVIKAIEKINE
jgi:hypothetical protein